MKKILLMTFFVMMATVSSQASAASSSGSGCGNNGNIQFFMLQVVPNNQSAAMITLSTGMCWLGNLTDAETDALNAVLSDAAYTNKKVFVDASDAGELTISMNNTL